MRFFFVVLIGLAISCQPKVKDVSVYKDEVLKAEKEFESAAKTEGLAAAFRNYAADNAVVDRGKLIHGKDSIGIFYNNTPDHVKLTWNAEFVDVSSAGDMAYTYGKYVYESVDSAGKPIHSTGIFHTVWKRQSDGTWKFVWD